MNKLSQLYRGAVAATVATLLVIAAPAAMAQTGPDYSVLTDAVDWSTIGALILTVFAAIAGVIVVFKGGKMVLKAIRGA